MQKLKISFAAGNCHGNCCNLIRAADLHSSTPVVLRLLWECKFYAANTDWQATVRPGKLTVVRTLSIVSMCHLVLGANFSAATKIPDEQSDLNSTPHLNDDKVQSAWTAWSGGAQDLSTNSFRKHYFVITANPAKQEFNTLRIYQISV